MIIWTFFLLILTIYFSAQFELFFLWFKWAKRYLSAHRMLSYGAISFKRPISKRQGWTIILFYLRFYLKYLFAHVNYFWLSNYFFALWTIFFSFELSFFFIWLKYSLIWTMFWFPACCFYFLFTFTKQISKYISS